MESVKRAETGRYEALKRLSKNLSSETKEMCVCHEKTEHSMRFRFIKKALQKLRFFTGKPLQA